MLGNVGFTPVNKNLVRNPKFGTTPLDFAEDVEKRINANLAGKGIQVDTQRPDDTVIFVANEADIAEVLREFGRDTGYVLTMPQVAKNDDGNSHQTFRVGSNTVDIIVDPAPTS